MAIRQRQIRNRTIDTVANLGSLTGLEAEEIIFVQEKSTFYRIRNIALPADGEYILATGTPGMTAHAMELVGRGQVIGSAATYAALPDATLAQHNGKFAIMTARDGQNKKGLYQSDGSNWIYVAAGDDAIMQAAAPGATNDAGEGYQVGDVWVDTSSTPRKAYIATDVSAGAAVWSELSSEQSPVIFKGTWDASSGSFPGGGTAETGHMYVVDTAGTVDGQSFDVGDSIYAVTDSASTTTYAGNWRIVQGVVPAAGRLAAVETTVAAFPAAGDWSGYLAMLTAPDGTNLFPTFFLSDGTNWNPIYQSRVKTDTSDPTVNDDANAGYRLGDVWINTTDDGYFVLTDNAAGAAKWSEQGGVNTVREAGSVTATNTVANLGATPANVNDVRMFVNGMLEWAGETPAPFSVTGQAVTWNAGNAGYNLETTDTVMFEYEVLA